MFSVVDVVVVDADVVAVCVVVVDDDDVIFVYFV